MTGSRVCTARLPRRQPGSDETRGRTSMSRNATSAPAIQPGQGDVGPTVRGASLSAPERGRLGMLRRRRDVPGRISRVDNCPVCGLRIRDKVAARLGFCDRCNEFTGMCGAGRRIICPDLMTRTSWHTPCTELGAVAWEINQGQGFARTMLCRVHDNHVRGGGTPWIVDAAPVEQPGSRRARQSATGHLR